MEIRDLLRLTRKWFWLLLLACLIGGAAGLAVDLLQPKVYQASATLFVSSPNRSDINTLLGDQQAAAALASFPHSDTVLRATLQVIGDKSLSLSQLASIVSVQNDRSTQFVTITVSDSEPVRAALLASEIAKQSIIQFQAMITDPGGTQLAQDLQYQVTQLAIQIKNTEDELTNQEQQLSNIENHPVADSSSQTSLINQQTARINQINSNLNGLRSAYGQLYSEQISYYGSLSSTQVTLLQDAQVPQNPARLQRTLAIAMGALAGLIAIVGIIIFIEQTDDTLRTSAKVNKATPLPILTTLVYSSTTSRPLPLLNGFSENEDQLLKRSLSLERAEQTSRNQIDKSDVTIKLSPLKAKLSTAVLDNQNGVKARNTYQLREEFLTLGVFLSNSLKQMSTNGSKFGSLLVSSPENGDGKTFIASQIALGLARLGVKVVLIDANLCNPKIHTLYGLSNSSGLSTLLIGSRASNSIDAVLQETGEPHLMILPAGPAIGSPSQLLASPMMVNIIEQVKNKAYVIIDSSAVLNSSEPVIMANISERALLVVDAQHTTASKLKRSLEMLTLTTVDIVGIVLNRTGKEY